MAKKKNNREDVNTMLWKLNYVYNSISCYGNENDYSHDLMASHLEDVIEVIKKDKEAKEAVKNTETEKNG